MSTLKTNAIQTTSGKPILNSTGSVLQVVQSVYSSQFAATPGANNFATLPISLSITPSSASNKIVCIWTLHVRNDGARSGIGLRRNSTDIFGYREAYGALTDGGVTHTFQYIDSPATTSATTYKVMFAVNSGTALLTDVGGILATGSNVHRITLMEVSG